MGYISSFPYINNAVSALKCTQQVILNIKWTCTSTSYFKYKMNSKINKKHVCFQKYLIIHAKPYAYYLADIESDPGL